MTIHPKKGNIWKMLPNRGRKSEQRVDPRFWVPDFLLLISSAPTARQTPCPAWGSLQRFSCQCRLATPTTFSVSVNVPQTVCVFKATLLLHLHMKGGPLSTLFGRSSPQKMIWRIVSANQRLFFPIWTQILQRVTVNVILKTHWTHCKIEGLEKNLNRNTFKDQDSKTGCTFMLVCAQICQAAGRTRLWPYQRANGYI